MRLLLRGEKKANARDERFIETCSERGNRGNVAWRLTGTSEEMTVEREKVISRQLNKDGHFQVEGEDIHKGALWCHYTAPL